MPLALVAAPASICPAKVSGLLRPPAKWREIELADHGFGQGVAVHADSAGDPLTPRSPTVAS